MDAWSSLNYDIKNILVSIMLIYEQVYFYNGGARLLRFRNILVRLVDSYLLSFLPSFLPNSLRWWIWVLLLWSVDFSLLSCATSSTLVPVYIPDPIVRDCRIFHDVVSHVTCVDSVTGEADRHVTVASSAFGRVTVIKDCWCDSPHCHR